MTNIFQYTYLHDCLYIIYSEMLLYVISHYQAGLNFLLIFQSSSYVLEETIWKWMKNDLAKSAHVLGPYHIPLYVNK